MGFKKLIMLSTGLAICFFILGCDSRHLKQGLNDLVLDNSRNQMLVVERTKTPIEGAQGSGVDWNALVWMVKQNGEWKEKKRITQGDFQSGSDRRRWIVEVDGFDPDKGTAIIKVAEGHAPLNAVRVSYSYSWREWSILTNADIRLLRICNDPFEKY